MRGLLLAAFVEAGIITWRDLSKEKMLPLPSDYVAVAIYFGLLGLLPSSASNVSNALGWGMVLATFLNLFDPTNPAALIFPGQAQQVSGPVPSAPGVQGFGPNPTAGMGQNLQNNPTGPAGAAGAVAGAGAGAGL